MIHGQKNIKDLLGLHKAHNMKFPVLSIWNSDQFNFEQEE